ncbi:hypothetical protein V3C99_015148 [Haemonchus contortus]
MKLFFLRMNQNGKRKKAEVVSSASFPTSFCRDGTKKNNAIRSAKWLSSIVLPVVTYNMTTPKPAAQNNDAVFVPLVMPKVQTPDSSTSLNIFRMILNDGRRTKPAQPVIDLEADFPTVATGDVTDGPVAKKPRESKEEGEVTDDSSESMSVICVDDDLDSTGATRAGSPDSVTTQQLDCTIEERTTQGKQPTLRDVLSNLSNSCEGDNLEEGEIVEEQSVVVLSEDSMNLTLRSQVEGEVIDLTVEKDNSDCDSEVVCLDDLTIIDEEEITIIKSEKTAKHKRRSSKRMSFRTSVSTDLQKKPSKDDALSKAALELSGVPLRYWETFKAAPVPSSSNTEFRVCCYNVLCQLTTLKTMYLYGHLRADEGPLRWEHRWPILEQELIRLNADILGLQEVQYDHYDSCFRSSMSKVGYLSYYKKRTGMMNDGCAVFVRKSKFDVVSYRIVEYFVAAGTSMDRDQIGQVLRLRCKKTGQELIYANTHLIFNSARGDIKIGQLAMLFANIIDELTKSSCPVIINGDFNIEPLSYVYTYISESSVYLRGLPRNELSGQGQQGGPCVQADSILPSAARIGRDSMFIDEKAPRKAVDNDFFTHPLRLASVYHHFNEDGEKEVSTYHKDVANPDFIFYTIEKKKCVDSALQVFETPELRLLRRLGLPGLRMLQNTLGPWPNHYVPSDHIPLVADFILTKTVK